MRTNKTKKVLIALDYGPTAKKVAETGYLLAKSMGAEVTLLHIITEPVYYSTPEYSPIMGFNGFMVLGPVEMKNLDTLKRVSSEFLDKSRKHLGDDTIQTLVKEGDFAETIIKTAKALRADVIVMGTHSQKWMENILRGSVTEKVLHHTSIPLYIIPTKKHSN